MPRLSIIIPSLGDWENLETTLVSVLRNRPPGSEVVVVLSRAYDDPYALREEIRFTQAPRQAQAVDLVNAGFAAARGELLHVLACGVTVFDGWAEPAVRHFDDPLVAAVAPLVLDSACPTRIVTAGCAWSRAGTRSSFAAGLSAGAIPPPGRDWVGPEWAAGFYRRSAVADVAGLDATLPAELAAVDLNLRLLESGFGSVLAAASRVAVGCGVPPTTQPLLDGWHGERLFWRHAARGGRLRNLAAHGWATCAEALSHVSRPGGVRRTIGRLIGVCDRRPARRAGFGREIHAPPSDQERRVDRAHVGRSLECGAAPRRPPVNLSPAAEKS